MDPVLTIDALPSAGTSSPSSSSSNGLSFASDARLLSLAWGLPRPLNEPMRLNEFILCELKEPP
eukprot:scaffold191175_cov52-Prasinocladus_malaysianus.AAC.1